MSAGTIKPALLAKCLAALQVAEGALTQQGQSGAWAVVMEARTKLQFALEDLQPVAVESASAPVPDFLKVPA